MAVYISIRKCQVPASGGIDHTAAVPSQPDRLDVCRSDHSAGSKNQLATTIFFDELIKKPVFFFEPAEWSERLTSRRSGWLGTAAVVWCKPARLTTSLNWRHFGLR